MFVTGGASGIGEAVVRMSIEAGAAVMAVDLGAESLEQLGHSFNAGDCFKAYVAYLTVEGEVRRVEVDADREVGR